MARAMSTRIREFLSTGFGGSDNNLGVQLEVTLEMTGPCGGRPEAGGRTRIIFRDAHHMNIGGVIGVRDAGTGTDEGHSIDSTPGEGHAVAIEVVGDQEADVLATAFEWVAEQLRVAGHTGPVVEGFDEDVYDEGGEETDDDPSSDSSDGTDDPDYSDEP